MFEARFREEGSGKDLLKGIVKRSEKGKKDLVV
jgi:hypothetical protein